MRRRTAVAIAAAGFVLAGVVAAGIVGFPRTSVRASNGPVELPSELETVVSLACIPEGSLASIDASGPFLSVGTVGDGAALRVQIGEPGGWQVEAGSNGAMIQLDDASEETAAVGGPAWRAVSVAQELYSCLTPYRFVEPTAGTDSASQLLQLYEYDTRVLWPCLTGQGIDVGEPPTRADFRNSVTVTAVNPFRTTTLTRAQLPRLARAVRACPLRPAYLG